MEMPMSEAVMTIVDAKVDPAREAELLEGYRLISEGDWPAGLLRTELLRGREGAWRVQSTWRSLDALRALRATGARPLMLDLLDRLGAVHSHDVFTVQLAYASQR
jgi:hypothetical protein